MFHERFLPMVFGMLDDPRLKVQQASCFVLETFCEDLDPEAIIPYSDELIVKLMTLTSHSSRSVRHRAVAATCSVTIASGARMTPYFPQMYGDTETEKLDKLDVEEG